MLVGPLRRCSTGRLLVTEVSSSHPGSGACRFDLTDWSCVGKVGRVAPVWLSRFVVVVWECPNLENSTVCFKSMPIFAWQGLCGLVVFFSRRVASFLGLRVGFL